MGQNYNLNSAFGLNVSTRGPKTSFTQQRVAEIKEKVNEALDSMTSYVDKYEDVFTGEVEKEINMYSRQMMIVGMNLKNADKTIRKFDMNI